EVPSLDDHIALLSRCGAMRLIRVGTLRRTGQRIAMLGDGTGVKLELIEDVLCGAPRLAHLAFQVDGVDAVRKELTELGWEPVSGPNELPDARARSALLRDGGGLLLQVIRYESDSPDLV